MKNTIIKLASVTALVGAVNAQTFGAKWTDSTQWDASNPTVTNSLALPTGLYKNYDNSGVDVTVVTTAGNFNHGRHYSAGVLVSPGANGVNIVQDSKTMSYIFSSPVIVSFSIHDVLGEDETNTVTVNSGSSIALLAENVTPGASITNNSGTLTMQHLGGNNNISQDIDARTTAKVTQINFIADANDPTGSLNHNFTISTVPEPSSTALLGLGGLVLILRRKK